jgi:hypothetical protein
MEEETMHAAIRTFAGAAALSLVVAACGERPADDPWVDPATAPAPPAEPAPLPPPPPPPTDPMAPDTLVDTLPGTPGAPGTGGR